MPGNDETEMSFCLVAQIGVAASLVMKVKSSPQEDTQQFPGRDSG
jgi:hypothetical protein